MFEAINQCRICGHRDLKSIFDLGKLVSCGLFPSIDAKDPEAMPLDVVHCSECGLAQLAHNFATDDLFRLSYGYRSSLNESMVRHLGDLIEEVKSRLPLKAGDIVLDIGSNDGTTLGLYRQEGLVRVGIDPTIERFRSYYEPDIITLADFFTAENFRKVVPSGKARVITSIAMFYDLPEPHKFVSAIREVLAPDGLWVFEQSYLPTMIARRSFDTICHEHLEYYGLEQIRRLLTANGLRLVDVSLNDVNGGSFRITACQEDAPRQSETESINELLQREQSEGYSTGLPFENLKSEVEDIRATVMKFLREAKSKGQIVHGYGASTKGNTLLQYFGITTEFMPVIADRNPAKLGCRTPGSAIPIVSEEESRGMRPDFYFVLPWHFREAFLERERDFLDRGGRFVFPLPEFEIVGR